MKIIIRLCFFLLLFSLPLQASANDVHLWAAAVATHSPCNCTSYHLAYSQRWDQNVTNLFYQYLQFSIEKQICKCWTITPSYRQAARKECDNNGHTYWKAEAVPILDFKRTWSFCRSEFSMRHRFQYKSIENDYRYRNRVDFSSPPLCLPLKPSFYISEEIFLRDFHRFFQNRITFGIHFEKTQFIDAFIGFMLLNEKDPNWVRDNVWLITISKDF